MSVRNLIRRTTQAQLERSIRAASKQGIPVQSITHHPDGRVTVVLLEGVAPNPINEWDELD